MPRARRPMTLIEFARLGGRTLQASRTPAQRSAYARKAVRARWKAHKKRIA